ncbi:Hsp70 family protein [Opitutus sp. ER46]|uniref:Hsp70 family protein n=1 Tax=Opitutus sp. ER46 TaxID=2161864 RepID=UPI000D31AF72|nr:Hsp70 family protein [Opitutus sp. ER46]PTX91195.1 hypothetical protein DB354_21425 [Opitutus sp. ER46]
MSYAPQIGVDFGTTKTLVSRWMGRFPVGHPEPIRLGTGRDDIPTVLYSEGNGAFAIGEEAEDKAVSAPSRYVDNFKRLLGTDTNRVIDGESFTPVDLTAAFLRDLVAQCQAKATYATIERAVITVPVSFGPAACESLEQAARRVGFKEITLLPEPAAAAYAYLHEQKRAGRPLAEDHRVLVFDFGGGTLDLALVTLKGDAAFAHPSLYSGDARLGGVDIDERLAAWVDEQLAQQGEGPLSALPIEYHSRNRRALVECKERLSRAEKAAVLIENGQTPRRFECTRELFNACIEDLCAKAVRLTVELLERCAREGLTPAEVLLIGGSSQIALVRQMLKAKTALPLVDYANALAAVSLGAAHYCASQGTDKSTLTGRDLLEFETIRELARSPGSTSDDFTSAASRADVLLSSCPDHLELWRLRAELAVKLNDRVAGVKAAVQFIEAGLINSSAEDLRPLLLALNRKNWIADAEALLALRQSIEAALQAHDVDAAQRQLDEYRKLNSDDPLCASLAAAIEREQVRQAQELKLQSLESIFTTASEEHAHGRPQQAAETMAAVTASLAEQAGSWLPEFSAPADDLQRRHQALKAAIDEALSAVAAQVHCQLERMQSAWDMGDLAAVESALCDAESVNYASEDVAAWRVKLNTLNTVIADGQKARTARRWRTLKHSALRALKACPNAAAPRELLATASRMIRRRLILFGATLVGCTALVIAGLLYRDYLHALGYIEDARKHAQAGEWDAASQDLRWSRYAWEISQTRVVERSIESRVNWDNKVAGLLTEAEEKIAQGDSAGAHDAIAAIKDLPLPALPKVLSEFIGTAELPGALSPKNAARLVKLQEARVRHELKTAGKAADQGDFEQAKRRLEQASRLGPLTEEVAEARTQLAGRMSLAFAELLGSALRERHAGKAQDVIDRFAALTGQAYKVTGRMLIGETSLERFLEHLSALGIDVQTTDARGMRRAIPFVEAARTQFRNPADATAFLSRAYADWSRELARRQLPGAALYLADLAAASGATLDTGFRDELVRDATRQLDASVDWAIPKVVDEAMLPGATQCREQLIRTLAGPHAGWLSCASGGRAPLLTTVIALDAVETEDEKKTSEDSVRYKTGTHTETNPDYERAKRMYDAAYEHATFMAMSSARMAYGDPYGAMAAVQNIQRAQRDMEEAADTLRRTPAWVEVPTYAKETYTIIDHALTHRLPVRIEFSRGGKTLASPLSGRAATSERGREIKGNRARGVPVQDPAYMDKATVRRKLTDSLLAMDLTVVAETFQKAVGEAVIARAQEQKDDALHQADKLWCLRVLWRSSGQPFAEEKTAQTSLRQALGLPAEGS